MDYIFPKLVDYDLTDDSWRENIITQFPACFNSGDESNNQKILNLFADLFIDQKNNLLSTFDQLRIQGATDGNLTELAKKWGVNRIDDDDDFLRFQIYVKIFQKRFGATEIGTKQFISKSLGIDIDSFQILPTDNLEDLYINNLPFMFKDNDKKEVKQAILFKAIQDNIPPTFKLTKIVYSVNSVANLKVGAIGGTFTVHDEPKKRNRNIDSTVNYHYAVGDSGNFSITNDIRNVNSFIYDPVNGLHIATASEINNNILGKKEN